jgi:uncharacterized protein (TIGR03083 family)
MLAGVDELVEMIAVERREMADLIGSLTEDQLGTPSLCGEWTVRDVAAHLYAAVSRPRGVLLLLFRNGFRLHRANAQLARELGRRPVAEIAAGLRDHAVNNFRPPVVGYLGPLTDLQVHGQDIRRPLGIYWQPDPVRVRVSLDFLVGGRAFGFVPGKRAAGLRFEATDLAWSWGEGPTISGTAEALMLALCGRTVVLPELAGDGVATLERRLAPAQ